MFKQKKITTLKQAEAAAEALRSCMLQEKAAKDERAQIEGALRDYCEANKLTGEVGSMLAYTRSTTKLSAGDAKGKLLEQKYDKLRAKLPDAYLTEVPATTAINEKDIKDNIGHDKKLVSALKAAGFELITTMKTHFKHIQ